MGSGTVARTKRCPLSEAEAAVIAWMRHQTTAYDSMVIPAFAESRSPEGGSTVTPDFRSVSNWGGSKSRVSSLSIAFRGSAGNEETPIDPVDGIYPQSVSIDFLPRRVLTFPHKSSRFANISGFGGDSYLPYCGPSRRSRASLCLKRLVDESAADTTTGYDLNGTILHLLGIDRTTDFRHNGLIGD